MRPRAEAHRLHAVLRAAPSRVDHVPRSMKKRYPPASRRLSARRRRCRSSDLRALGRDLVARTEIDHVLRLRDAARVRSGQGVPVQDEIHLADFIRVRDFADAHAAVRGVPLQERDEAIQVVPVRDGIKREVTSAASAPNAAVPVNSLKASTTMEMCRNIEDFSLERSCRPCNEKPEDSTTDVPRLRVMTNIGSRRHDVRDTNGGTDRCARTFTRMYSQPLRRNSRPLIVSHTVSAAAARR